MFFFRARIDSGIAGVSLLFHLPGVHSLGIDSFEIKGMAECTLHTLDLGVAQRFCGTAMVRALCSNIYNLPCKSKGKLIARGALVMNKAIKAYYKYEREKFPWKRLSQLSKTFSHKCLFQSKRPCLKAKGGQTRCLVKFCTELMQKHGLGTQGRLLARAGEALMDVYQVMAREPRKVSLEGRQQLVAAMVNHVVCYKAAGGHLVYKHHGAIHMALMAGSLGNPRHISTYEDEHENGMIARIGIGVHGATFAKSVFERLELQNPRRRMMQILE